MQQTKEDAAKAEKEKEKEGGKKAEGAAAAAENGTENTKPADGKQ